MDVKTVSAGDVQAEIQKRRAESKAKLNEALLKSVDAADKVKQEEPPAAPLAAEELAQILEREAPAQEAPPPTAPVEKPVEAPVEAPVEVPVEAPVEGATPPAEAPPDEFAEFEEGEILDTSGPIKFRAPKGQAQKIKDGFLRRDAFDRKTQKIAPFLTRFEPYIESGALMEIAPLLEAALTRPDYGRIVADAYQRLAQGLPLTQDEQKAAAVGMVLKEAGEEPAGEDLEGVDPFVAAAVAPLDKQIRAMSQRLEERDRREQEIRQAEEQRRAQFIAQETAAKSVREYMAMQYPTEFTGTLDDDPKLVAILKFAKDQGYLQSLGYTPQMFEYSLFKMRDMGIAVEPIYQRPAAAATPPSQAAQTIADLDAMRKQKSAEAAAKVAGRVTSGSGTAARGAPPPIPAKLPTRHKDGRPLTAKEYSRLAFAKVEAEIAASKR